MFSFSVYYHLKKLNPIYFIRWDKCTLITTWCPLHIDHLIQAMSPPLLQDQFHSAQTKLEWIFIVKTIVLHSSHMPHMVNMEDSHIIINFSCTQEIWQWECMEILIIHKYPCLQNQEHNIFRMKAIILIMCNSSMCRVYWFPAKKRG